MEGDAYVVSQAEQVLASGRRRLVSERLVELLRDIAFEAPVDLSTDLALCCSPLGVGNDALVDSEADWYSPKIVEARFRWVGSFDGYTGIVRVNSNADCQTAR